MSFRLASSLLFLSALGLRLLHIVELRSAPFFSLLLGDARSYDGWARRIAAGRPPPAAGRRHTDTLENQILAVVHPSGGRESIAHV